MPAEQIFHLIPYIISASVSLGIGWYTWQHRNVSGAYLFGWVTIGQALTTIAYIAEMSSNDLRVKIFWDDVQWFTLTFTSISLIVFSLDYTNRPPKYPRRLWLILLIFPTIFLLLVMTNPLHNLIRTNANVIPGEIFSILTYTFTPITYVFAAYLLVLGFGTMGLVARRIFEVGTPYRAQVITVLLGVGIPEIVGVMVILGVYLADQRDITPLAFAVGDAIVAWGLFRYRLFEVAPIARTTVFESLSDAVLVLDMQGRIVDLNPAAETLIAQFSEVKRVVGLPVRQVFVQWALNFQEFTGQETTYQTELVVKPVTTDPDIDENPGELTFFASVSPIKAREDFITGHVILLRDITDRKSTEAQLMQRTHELERARSIAEKADRQKSHFVAAVSHELRTPLNAIINFNQFVSSGLFGEVNGKQVEALEKSTAGARHLLALINDLLDIAKIEAGHTHLELQGDVNLIPEIHEAITVSRSLIGEKPVNIFIEIEGELPLITVDLRRFKQILLNLLSNAVKFTDTGYVRVCAWTATRSASNEADRITDKVKEIVFSIEDTGPGIPPEYQSMIFEPFHQLKRDSGKTGSTGLGLPLTLRLVQAHGGRLWLDSKVGEGSIFYFTLPLLPPATTSPHSSAALDTDSDVTIDIDDFATSANLIHADSASRDVFNDRQV